MNKKEGTKSSNHDCTKDGGVQSTIQGTRFPHRIPRRRRAAARLLPARSRNRIKKPHGHQADPSRIKQAIRGTQIKRRTWASAPATICALAEKQSKRHDPLAWMECVRASVLYCFFLMVPSSFVRSNGKAGEGRAAQPKSGGPASPQSCWLICARSKKEAKAVRQFHNLHRHQLEAGRGRARTEMVRRRKREKTSEMR